ncbi:MAG: metallophosphoesterase [Planctomycetota bacterium]
MSFVWLVMVLGVAHAAAGVIAVCVVVRGGRLDGARLVWAGGLATMVVVGSLWYVRRRFDLTPFEMLSLVYVDLAVVGPLVGASVVFALWRVRGEAGWRPWVGVGRVLGVCAVMPLPVALWATFVEPNLLVVERASVEVTQARRPSRPIRVAVVADVQNWRVGAQERRVLARLRDVQPDLIVIPGDLFQPARRTWPDFQPALDEVADDFRWFLASMHEIAPTFFTPGNCEYGYNDRALIDGTGVEYLRYSEPGRVEVGGRRVYVFGVGFALTARSAPHELARMATLVEDDDVVVLVSHSPDTVLVLPGGARPDVTVAGHTHGGQVKIPWYGPILRASRVPRKVAGGGLHEVNGNRVYVSRGVGVERMHSPRVRFNCVPEVSLIELR